MGLSARLRPERSQAPRHPASSGGTDYDAFVSYSHAADGRLAEVLQSRLQTFAKPWYRRRAIRLFRDTAGLGLTPDLLESIRTALEASQYFLLFASEQDEAGQVSAVRL